MKWWIMLSQFVLVVVFVFCLVVYLMLIHPGRDSEIEGQSEFSSHGLVRFGRSVLTGEDEEKELECELVETFEADRCEFVTVHDCQTIYKMYYCFFEKGVLRKHTWLAKILFYGVSGYVIFVMFYLMSDTTDEYFSPALLELSDTLRLPPNIAGVTLLACGASAPELSSIIAGIVNGNSDLAFSVPIGGGVLVASVIVGCVALVSRAKVNRRPFIRDVFSYLLGSIFLMVVYLSGNVHLSEALFSFVLYLIYVLIVVIGRVISRKIKKKKLKKQQLKQELIGKQLSVPLIEEEDVHNALKDEDYESDDWFGGWESRPIWLDDPKGKDKRSSNYVYVPKIGFVLQEKGGYVVKKLAKEQNPTRVETELTDVEIDGKTVVISDYFSAEMGTVPDSDGWIINEEDTLISKFRNFIDSFTGWSEKKIYQKIFYVLIGWYCDLFRMITIPKVGKENWNRYLASICPFFGSMFVLIQIFSLFELFSKWNWAFMAIWVSVAAISSLAGLIIFFTTTNDRPPIYRKLFLPFSFVLCMAWVYFLAETMVSFLEVIGATLRIPTSIFGVTVLALGNSLGDLVTNASVARKGFPSMAIGASYAGPLLNALVGLGIAFTFDTIKASITEGAACSPIQFDAVVTISFIFLILILLTCLILVPLCGFVIRKPIGLLLFVIYIIYCIFAILSVVVKPFEKFILKLKFPFSKGCL